MSELDKVQESLFERWKNLGRMLGEHGNIVQNSWERGLREGIRTPNDQDVQEWLESITALGLEVKELREDTVGAYQEFKHNQQQSEKE